MFFRRGSFSVGNGLTTRFWEDTWLGDAPLGLQYPSLHNIVQQKDVSVASVLGSNPLNISFRGELNGDKWTAWLHLLHRLMSINLSQEPDVFRWRLHTSGVFFVKSMYADLINTGPFSGRNISERSKCH